MYRARIKSAVKTRGYLVGWLALICFASFLLWWNGYWRFVDPAQPKPEKPGIDLPISQWLYHCSPFESMNGQQMVTFFQQDHSVAITEAAEDEREKGALFATHPKRMQGTWTADGVTYEVATIVDGLSLRYMLLIPFGLGST